MNQYAIYLRKSRADDPYASIEETLSRHEKILLETAKKMKLNIIEIYREVVSGETIADRPQMLRLLNAVDQGLYKGVLVVEIERLARGNSIDQGIISQSFQLSSTNIITPNKVIDPNNEYDSESLEFGLFMSRREYKTINRRLQRGRIASVKEGKYLGNKPPYGYARKKLDKQKGYTLEINPDQVLTVKMIFELYTKGERQSDGTYKRLGAALIVRKLNDLRIPPMNGDVWATSTVQGILRNPVYVGKIRWNSRPAIKKMVDGQMKKERPRAKQEEWILVEGLHEAIIDNEVWGLAQDYIANNPPKPCPSKQVIKNPLSGLIICGMCGLKMVRRPYKGKQPDVLMCPSTACQNVSSRLCYVEEQLLKSLDEWLYDYKIDWDLNSDKKSIKNVQLDIEKKAIKKLEDEFKNLELQIDTLHNLLEQGIYSTDKFLERSRLLSDRINKVQIDREKLLENLRYEEMREENQKVIIPKIEKALELYKATDDPALKNDLLKDIIEKAVYTKTVNGRWHNKPDDFELALYPKVFN